MTTLNSINRLFKVIENSLFMTTGNLDYDRVTDAIISLSNSIHNYHGDTEQIWYIGESGCCYLPDLIEGAFWHYTEWHSGQWSKGYAALSALGAIFSPGMTTPDTENDAYIQLEAIAGA